MDREEFKKKMENHTVMTDDMMSNIQALHLKNTKKSEIYIVAMEELSELQKEISKELRGQGDRDSILEELADVMIVCGNIMNLQKITDAELRAAAAVKLNRILSTLVEKENGNETKIDSNCCYRYAFIPEQRTSRKAARGFTARPVGL